MLERILLLRPTMKIYPLAKNRKDCNSIAKEVREKKIDIETYNHREQLLKLSEDLLQVEEKRLLSKGIAKKDAYFQWDSLV